MAMLDLVAIQLHCWKRVAPEVAKRHRFRALIFVSIIRRLRWIVVKQRDGLGDLIDVEEWRRGRGMRKGQLHLKLAD